MKLYDKVCRFSTAEVSPLAGLGQTSGYPLSNKPYHLSNRSKTDCHPVAVSFIIPSTIYKNQLAPNTMGVPPRFALLRKKLTQDRSDYASPLRSSRCLGIGLTIHSAFRAAYDHPRYSIIAPLFSTLGLLPRGGLPPTTHTASDPYHIHPLVLYSASAHQSHRLRVNLLPDKRKKLNTL